MEKELLIALIKNPTSTKVDIEAIQALRKKYPYCSTFSLLELIGLHQKGAFGFNEQLENDAHRVANRAILKSYLNPSNDFEGLNPETPTPFAETKKESKNDFAKAESIQSEETNDDISETKIAPQELDELDFEIINSAIDSSIQMDVEESIEQEERIPKIEIPLKEKETIDLEPIEIEAEEKTTFSSERQKEVQENSEPKSFIEWLKYQSQKKEETQNQAILENENPAVKNLGVETEKTSIEKAKEELLDKFIADEPRMSKPKQEFFSPTKKAKESLEENGDLITETLAKIYVLQKKYSKAIEAYEKLSLIYPEKKPFFANQIKRIKEKQNV